MPHPRIQVGVWGTALDCFTCRTMWPAILATSSTTVGAGQTTSGIWKRELINQASSHIICQIKMMIDLVVADNVLDSLRFRVAIWVVLAIQVITRLRCLQIHFLISCASNDLEKRLRPKVIWSKVMLVPVECHMLYGVHQAVYCAYLQCAPRLWGGKDGHLSYAAEKMVNFWFGRASTQMNQINCNAEVKKPLSNSITTPFIIVFFISITLARWWYFW